VEKVVAPNWKMSDTLWVCNKMRMVHGLHSQNLKFPDSIYNVDDSDIWKLHSYKLAIFSNQQDWLQGLWDLIDTTFMIPYKAINIAKYISSMCGDTCFIWEAFNIGVYKIFYSKFLQF